MRVRGHNLVWATGAQVPLGLPGRGRDDAALGLEPADVQLLTARIQNHIKNWCSISAPRSMCGTW